MVGESLIGVIQGQPSRVVEIDREGQTIRILDLSPWVADMGRGGGMLIPIAGMEASLSQLWGRAGSCFQRRSLGNS